MGFTRDSGGGCESLSGDYAWAFDNPADTLAGSISSATLFGVDVTEFLDNEVTRAPVTLYVFHVVRTLLDVRRFVSWADELSRLLADPAFEQFAKDGLKVWRKLNGVLCSATQSPSDALKSPIARTIIEQTPTKILFPNPDADRSEYQEGFGLTEAGIQTHQGAAGAQDTVLPREAGPPLGRLPARSQGLRCRARRDLGKSQFA